MALVDRDLTIEQLNAAPWREVVESSPRGDCWSYDRLFFQRAEAEAAAGNHDVERALVFLGRVASMMLRPAEDGPALQAQCQWATGRSSTPEDLSEAEVHLLRDFFPMVDDPELRARLADLVWIVSKNHLAARAAIESYFDSAERLLPIAPWTYVIDRLGRGVRLAALLGKDGENYSTALARLADAFRNSSDSGEPQFVVELLGILLEHGVGNPTEMATYAGERARALEGANKTELSRQYWHISSRFRAIQGDENGRLAALQALAETHLADAARASLGDHPRPMVALHHLTRAIEAFRRLPGARCRVEEIQKQLPELEAAAMKGMAPISTPFDPTEMARRAREAIAGKPFADALQVLAFSAGPVPLDDLREEVLKSARDFPIRHLASRVSIDGAGRTVGRRGPIEPQDPDEEAVQVEMFEHLRLYRHVHIIGVVEPMRQEIARTHRVRNSDLFFLVESNPFVEPGHEQLFLRGLKAGLEGDFMAADHFLIPQIENSLRKLLFDAGVSITTFDDRGVQKLIGLEVLLRETLLVEMLGNDAVFDLRGLLVERNSSCLRHRLAHGILADADFGASDAVYVWWIALRLCLAPIAYRNRQTDGSGGSGEAGQGESASSAEDPPAPA